MNGFHFYLDPSAPTDDLRTFLRGFVACFPLAATSALLFHTTGLMLASALLLMVGEEAQEMPCCTMLPTTEILPLVRATSPWTGLWFSIFPTVETLSAQALAAFLVFGSYITAQPFAGSKGQFSGESSESRT